MATTAIITSTTTGNYDENSHHQHDEFLRREKLYLDDLAALAQLRRIVPAFGGADANTTAALFLNADELLTCHQSFAALAMDDNCSLEQLFRSFVRCGSAFQLAYRYYLANYARALEVLESCKRSDKFCQVVCSFLKTLESPQKLPMLLARPVQRICQYPRLFHILLESQGGSNLARAALETSVKLYRENEIHLDEIAKKDQTIRRLQQEGKEARRTVRQLRRSERSPPRVRPSSSAAVLVNSSPAVSCRPSTPPPARVSTELVCVPGSQHQHPRSHSTAPGSLHSHQHMHRKTSNGSLTMSVRSADEVSPTRRNRVMSHSADGITNPPADVTPLELSSAACSALSSPGTPEPLDNSGKQRALELQPYCSPPHRPQSVPVTLDLQGVTPTSSAATTSRSRGSSDNSSAGVITAQSTPRSPSEKRARRQKLVQRIEQLHAELTSLHGQLLELC
jgi:hypothetical protein